MLKQHSGKFADLAEDIPDEIPEQKTGIAFCLYRLGKYWIIA